MIKRASVGLAVAVAWISIAFLCGSRGATAQVSAANPLDAIVVDSTGATLGKVVGIEPPTFTYVAVPSHKKWYLLRLDGRNDFRGAGNFAINFSSFDCSGQ